MFIQEKWTHNVHTETCRWQILTALFIIARNWKQFKCSTHCWFSHKTKRNRLLVYATKWMNPKYVLLSERSQAQKITQWMISFIWHARKAKPIGTGDRSMIAGGRERGWLHRDTQNVSVECPHCSVSWWWQWLRNHMRLSKLRELYTMQRKSCLCAC